MNVRKILLPTDFSDCSKTALDMATSLARDTGAELLIVYVQEPPLAAGSEGIAYSTVIPPTDDLLARLEQEIPEDHTIRRSHHLLKGSAIGAIVDFAEQQHVDLIVMGTHGHTGLVRLLMGSVAEGVVRRAPCAVLTVKQAARPPEV